MNGCKKVTIGIPARNPGKFLGHTLENIRRSSYPKDLIEVIIGNHGSTDPVEDIVASYKAYIDLREIKIPYDGPNRPLCRNRIIEQATGDIIIFIDSDILISRNFISEHVDLQLKYNGALVTGCVYGKTIFAELQSDDLAELDYTDISSSEKRIKSNPDYRDFRLGVFDFIKGGEPYEILTNVISPYRPFYTCNLSAMKKDIISLSGFDEKFSGWGLEDEELAYRFYLNKREFIFSHSAWGFHMPHPIVLANQNALWRKNRQYFFMKYRNQELELFNAFGTRMQTAYQEVGFLLTIIPRDDEYHEILGRISLKLPEKKGMRLGIFIEREVDALLLGLDHCFIPFDDKHRMPYTIDKRTFWSLIGFRTPFENNSMDEIILIADSLMFIEDSFVTLILAELARIAKKALVCIGERTMAEQYSYIFNRFMNTLGSCRFNEVEFINF